MCQSAPRSSRVTERTLAHHHLPPEHRVNERDLDLPSARPETSLAAKRVWLHTKGLGRPSWLSTLRASGLRPWATATRQSRYTEDGWLRIKKETGMRRMAPLPCKLASARTLNTHCALHSVRRRVSSGHQVINGCEAGDGFDHRALGLWSVVASGNENEYNWALDCSKPYLSAATCAQLQPGRSGEAMEPQSLMYNV